MLMRILQTSWLFGLVVGVLFASLIAVFATYSDWSANPGELFQGPGGTHWQVVFDTALSWFVPAFVYAFFVATALHLGINRLVEVSNRNNNDNTGNRDA